MERTGDRQGQMERYCSTGQSPQRAVALTEEEEVTLRQYLRNLIHDAILNQKFQN